MRRVSIIIPVYNYEKYLGEAIDSALGQEVEGDVWIEVIVVDDGSIDGSAGIAESYGDRVVLVRRENGGLPTARNTGIELARGDFLVFLDADDRLVDRAVDRFLEGLENKGDDFLLAGCSHSEMGGDGVVTDEVAQAGEGGREVGWRDLVLKNRFCTTVLVRREAVLQAGMFDETMRACEDRDLWIRVSELGRVWVMPDRLVEVRKHGANMTYDPDRQAGHIRKVIEKARESVWGGREKDPGLWMRALSVMDYQDSFMQFRGGKRSKALGRLARSVLRWPWFAKPTEQLGLPVGFRVRRLVKILRG